MSRGYHSIIIILLQCSPTKTTASDQDEVQNEKAALIEKLGENKGKNAPKNTNLSLILIAFNNSTRSKITEPKLYHIMLFQINK